MSKKISLLTSFIFLIFLFLFLPNVLRNSSVVLAQCCGCRVKTDPQSGECEIPSGFGCTSCQWCAPGEGSCPAPTNRPPPPQPTDPPDPGLTSNPLPTSGGGGPSPTGIIYGGPGENNCPDFYTKSRCPAAFYPNIGGNVRYCEWQYVNTNCIADLGCSGNSYTAGDCWGFCPGESTEGKCNNRNECIWSDPQSHPQGQCEDIGGGGDITPTNAPATGTVTNAPARGTVQGNVFYDLNTDAKRQGGSGEVLLSGIRVRLRIPGTSGSAYNTITDDSAPNYSFSNINTGAYEFMELKNSGIYDLVKPCSSITPPANIPNGRYYVCRKGNNVPQLKLWTVNGAVDVPGDKISLGSNQTYSVDFPLTTSVTLTPSSNTWMQVVGGDVYRPTINESVPSGSSAHYFTSSTNVAMGVLYSTSDPTITNDTNDGSYKKAIVSGYSNAYDFGYFSKKLSSKVSPGGNIENTNPSETVYAFDTSQTIGANITINPAKNAVIYIINGSLSINSNFSVQSGKAVAFIVSGDVSVNPAVTNIGGLFISNSFNTGTHDTNRLLIDGMVYTKTLVNGRTFESDTNPAFQITYQPAFILPLVSYLGKTQVTWEEVAP